MDKQFHINVKCIFNPLNSKYIIQQSKRVNLIDFSKQNKTLKLINLGRFTDQKNQILILKAVEILKKNTDKINYIG